MFWQRCANIVIHAFYKVCHDNFQINRANDAALVAVARRGRVPAYGDTAVRRPPEVHQGARSRDGAGQEHHAGRPEGRRQGRAIRVRHLRNRLRGQHPANAQAARRHRQGAGRRRPACAHQPHQRCADALHRRPDPARFRSRRRLRSRGDAPRDRPAVRPVRQTEQKNSARDPRFAGRHRRRRPPGRHRRRPPAAQARAEAGHPRDLQRRQAPRAPARPAGRRTRHPAGRKAHPWPRQAPDGKVAARVLPERTGQGHPEGTGRGRRRRRYRRAREEGHRRQDAERGARQGHQRDQEAQADVADVGRSDRRAQLHRHPGQPAVEEEVQGQQRPGRTPRRCSRATTTASTRSKNASWNTSRSSSASTS